MGLLLFIPLRNRTASLGSVFLPAFRGPKILRVKKILFPAARDLISYQVFRHIRQ